MLPGVEQSRVHHPGGLFLSGHPGHVLRNLHLRLVPRHSCGQILQPRAVLHHPGRDLPGLSVSFHPHRPPHRGLLLPSEASCGTLGSHVLLSPGDQNQSHRPHSGRQQEEDMHQKTEIHERLGSGGHRLHLDQCPAHLGNYPHHHGAS